MRCIRLIQLEPYQTTARIDIPFEVSFIIVLNAYLKDYTTDELHGLVSIRSNLFEGEVPITSYSDYVNVVSAHKPIEVYKGTAIPINGSYDFQFFDTNANWNTFTNIGATMIVEFKN